jgi:DNA replication licensing factor MCM4
MILIHNRSRFMNKQVIRLQETPDAVPDGQTPHTVSLCVYDELVDLVKPGDRIVVTGIFRAIPVRLNPRQRSIKALFKTYVDCVHIKRTNVGRMGFDASTRDGKVKPSGVGVGGEDDDMEILQGTVPEDADNDYDMNYSAAEKMEQDLIKLSHHPDIYNMLARSMAPSIYEMDDVKKGILLQLFGGTNKSIATGGGGGGPRYRGDINVLMVGDPGTSKSQILQVSDQLGSVGRQLIAVRPQDRAPWCVHLGQGLVGCRSHRVCHARPRLEAAGARVWCSCPLGRRRVLHRRV